MYRFSPNSTAILERCIKLAEQHKDTNRWKDRFLNKIEATMSDISVKHVKIVKEPKCKQASPEDMDIQETYTDDEYMEIEADPILNINDILGDSVNSEMLTKVAKNIDDCSAEKLFNHIMESQMDTGYMEKFFKKFLPEYLRQHQGRLCLDVMIKAYKVYPDQFHILLKNVMTSKISPNILQEFVSTLQPPEQREILKLIMFIDISINAFITYILTIQNCYKYCSGIELYDNFILHKLKQAAEYCVHDKQYGRLLLTYLQNSKFNKMHLKNIVELHRSPFRRPCLNMLNSTE